MNTKRKAPPQNPLVYWWNEFLFARSFLYTSPLSPEDCQNALYNIEHPIEGGWFSFNTMSKTVDIQPDHLDDSRLAHFDIRLKRRNRGIDYTMAKAEGSIAYDEQSGETVIQGRTKFGALYYVMIVGYVAIFGTVFLSLGGTFAISSFSWAIIIFLLILGYTWWRMYSDRNHLTELIGTTIRDAGASVSLKAKHKPGEGIIDPSMLGADETSGFFRKRR